MDRHRPGFGHGARVDLTVDEQLEANLIGIGQKPNARGLLDGAGAADLSAEHEVLHRAALDRGLGKHSFDEVAVNGDPHVRREVMIADRLHEFLGT